MKLIFVLVLNAVLLLFIYRGVFNLEFQGDGWQYAYGHHVYYDSNVFGELSMQGMRSSLAGASLTFGLIENNFGLDATVFYTFALIFKFLSVITFYFLVKKMTGNYIASLISSLLLCASLVGIEATHWVFNMYAYIGLIFITISIYLTLDLPTNFSLKRFFPALFFACLGIWYATMRTSGILPLILAFSVYKALVLKTRSSYQNLMAWVIGFVIFLPIDKFLLGQMESDYSQKHIIAEGIKLFQQQIAIGKFDFILSPQANLGAILLPDIVWYSFKFPEFFSFLGPSSLHNVFFPSFLIYLIFTKIFKKVWFSNLTLYGLLWTLLVLFISRLGPNNYTFWVHTVMALFGGYLMIVLLTLLKASQIPSKLKDLFLIGFLWSFLFLLLPGFQNGGPIFFSYHRYMATTAPSVPMVLAGLLTLAIHYKNKSFQVVIFSVAVFMIFNHSLQTQRFFDKKDIVHNKEVSGKIWKQFLEVVPNKPEYRDNPPTIFFDSANNQLDDQTLYESLYFGFIFRIGLDYKWRPDHVSNVYRNDDYLNLIKDIKKKPKLFEDFYAVRVQNQSLVDITAELKEKIANEI